MGTVPAPGTLGGEPGELAVVDQWNLALSGPRFVHPVVEFHAPLQARSPQPASVLLAAPAFIVLSPQISGTNQSA
jgi:hypothetical protein